MEGGSTGSSCPQQFVTAASNWPVLTDCHGATSGHQGWCKPMLWSFNLNRNSSSARRLSCGTTSNAAQSCQGSQECLETDGTTAISTVKPFLQQNQQQMGKNQGSQQGRRLAKPIFASITSNSPAGQSQWTKQAPSAPAASSSSSISDTRPVNMRHRSEPGSALADDAVQRTVQELAQDVFQQGQLLAGGRYKLIDKIGITLGLAEGRFTTVWQGQDMNSGRQVILKCLEAGDGLSYAAGMREAALHASVGRCPNIVPLLDAFEHRSGTGRHPVMVLEPCGSNLLNVIALYTSAEAMETNHRDSSAKLSGICDNPRALKRIARDTLTALDHLHRHGLAHMDISPDNILLDKEFVSQEELHHRALFPEGNFLKALQSKWRLLQSMLWSQSDQAAQAQQFLMKEMQASVRNDPRHHEDSLHLATYKLTDFGRAVPFKDMLPGIPSDFSPPSELQSSPQRFNQDGAVVLSDPTYQPPEEVLGLNYISPGYDMWKLGCLLFEAATDSKLFDTQLKAALQQLGREQGFSDQHYMLDAMVTSLGNVPALLAEQSPLHDELFNTSSDDSRSDKRPRKARQQRREATNKTLAIHAGAVQPTVAGNTVQELIKQRTVLSDAEAAAFAAFLAEMLKWEPSSRASAGELLQHEWLQHTQPLE